MIFIYYKKMKKLFNILDTILNRYFKWNKHIQIIHKLI